MGQIEDYSLFKLIVEQESIGKAAEILNIAKSAASRRLKLLEDRMELLLIERGAGQWHITPSGRALYDRIAPLVDDVADVTEEFTSQNQRLSGKLRVTIPEAFGMAILLPTLLEFRKAHPEIDLEMDFDDRLADLATENYDLAIRIMRMTDTIDPIAHLGTSMHLIAASAAYLERSPKITCPADLSEHQILQYGHRSRSVWTLENLRCTERVTLRPYFKSNTAHALLEAARRDMGIVRAPDFIIRSALQSGELVQVLPEFISDPVEVLMIKHPTKRMNLKMRTFVKAVQSACQRAEDGTVHTI